MNFKLRPLASAVLVLAMMLPIEAGANSGLFLPVGTASAQAPQGDELPGTTVLETVYVAGTPRDALVYLPASRPVDAAAPMILFFHGNGENTLDAVRRYGVREEAERAGMIAVFPNGSPAPLVNGQPGCCGWNDGRPIWGDFQPPDDVSFVSQLLDLLIGKYNVDPNRVFAAGMSNGGFMTFRLACELSDRFAAIAVGSGPRDDSSCSITHPLSVLEFHGTDDPLLPYQGFVSARGVPIPAPVDVVKFWSAFDGCPSNPDTSMVTSVVEERAYAPCRNGTEVRLYTTTGGHHCWPGAGYTDCTGDVDLSLKATPLMVSFFLAHPRQD